MDINHLQHHNHHNPHQELQQQQQQQYPPVELHHHHHELQHHQQHPLGQLPPQLQLDLTLNAFAAIAPQVEEAGGVPLGPVFADDLSFHPIHHPHHHAHESDRSNIHNNDIINNDNHHVHLAAPVDPEPVPVDVDDLLAADNSGNHLHDPTDTTALEMEQPQQQQQQLTLDNNTTTATCTNPLACSITMPTYEELQQDICAKNLLIESLRKQLRGREKRLLKQASNQSTTSLIGEAVLQSSHTAPFDAMTAAAMTATIQEKDPNTITNLQQRWKARFQQLYVHECVAL
jgi:hypothetical protein